jgi:branched-chain amino acid transport system ATP-binding protein
VIVVENLHTYYGHIHAIKGVSFSVRQGEITTLIGANGAGKSTTIKTICGLLHPREGSILLSGAPIQKLSADKVVALGVGYVPEGRRVFPVMTVDENLDMGAYHRSDQAEVAKDKARMYETFPLLKGREKQLAGSLSGGEQQMLAIARALMSKPKVLVMDEPSLGLAPLLVKRVFEIIAELNKQGMTILLCEQNARGALKIAHHGIVMETGKIRFADTASALRANPIVQHAYLGIQD